MRTSPSINSNLGAKASYSYISILWGNHVYADSDQPHMATNLTVLHCVHLIFLMLQVFPLSVEAQMTWDMLDNTCVQPGSSEEFSLCWVILWLLRKVADEFFSCLLSGRPFLRYKCFCNLLVGQMHDKVKPSVRLDTRQKLIWQLTLPPLLPHFNFPSLLLLLSYAF